jgi:RNA polymerase sigma factor (sigma-70 family)
MNSDGHAIQATVKAALIEGYARLRGYILKRVGDPAEAEEILNAFCTRALERSASINSENAVRSWLSQVLQSTIADHFRRKATRARREIELDQDDLAAAATALETDADGAVCACLRAIIKALPQEDAKLIEEIDLNEGDRQAAAEGRSVTVNALNVRLHRARTRLRNLLIQLCAGCEDHRFDACDCPAPVASGD